mmetsp:Transcript_25504/g.85359  ORF Transcript_25504/g.85359 Transcript_25504/m.85359 type:complete len:516 (-) Transcript_25504:3-1550(-)
MCSTPTVRLPSGSTSGPDVGLLGDLLNGGICPSAAVPCGALAGEPPALPAATPRPLPPVARRGPAPDAAGPTGCRWPTWGDRWGPPARAALAPRLTPGPPPRATEEAREEAWETTAGEAVAGGMAPLLGTVGSCDMDIEPCSLVREAGLLAAAPAPSCRGATRPGAERPGTERPGDGPGEGAGEQRADLASGAAAAAPMSRSRPSKAEPPRPRYSAAWLPSGVAVVGVMGTLDRDGVAVPDTPPQSAASAGNPFSANLVGVYPPRVRWGGLKALTDFSLPVLCKGRTAPPEAQLAMPVPLRCVAREGLVGREAGREGAGEAQGVRGGDFADGDAQAARSTRLSKSPVQPRSCALPAAGNLAQPAAWRPVGDSERCECLLTAAPANRAAPPRAGASAGAEGLEGEAARARRPAAPAGLDGLDPLRVLLTAAASFGLRPDVSSSREAAAVVTGSRLAAPSPGAVARARRPARGDAAAAAAAAAAMARPPQPRRHDTLPKRTGSQPRAGRSAASPPGA